MPKSVMPYMPTPVLVMVVLFGALWLAFLVLPSGGGWRRIPETGAGHRAWRHFLFSVLIAGVYPPLLILTHECGHYLVAYLLGYQATFSYAEVTFSADDIPRWHDLLVTAGGPGVEALLTFFGLTALIRFSQKSTQGAGFMFWAWSACAGAALHWLVVNFRNPFSDGARISSTLGAPHQLVPALMVLPALLVVVFILWVHRRQRTLVPLAAGFVVAVASMLLWMNVWGPKVFPKPKRPLLLPPPHQQQGSRVVARVGLDHASRTAPTSLARDSFASP